MTTKAKKPAKFPSHDAVIDATFAMIADKGLGKVKLSSLSRKFKVPLAEFYTVYPSVDSIIHRFIDQVDAAMIDSVDPDFETNGTKRDVYFDMFMSRFDTLQTHRDGVKRWLAELPKHPTLWAATLKRWEQSLSLMLDIAQDSPLFPVKKAGLAAIYAVSMRAWMKDDTDDMSKTMVSLDKSLAKAEDFVALFLTRKKSA